MEFSNFTEIKEDIKIGESYHDSLELFYNTTIASKREFVYHGTFFLFFDEFGLLN